MGRLAELKGKREDMDWDNPDRIKLEEEINGIEDWCISKGYIKRKTTWEKGDGKKKAQVKFNRALRKGPVRSS